MIELSQQIRTNAVSVVEPSNIEVSRCKNCRLDIDRSDDNGGGNIRKVCKGRKHRKPPSPFIVKLRYLFLSSLAIFVTITCPGHTILWEQEKNGRIYQYQIIVVYVLILLSLFRVHGSDPGYLTQSLMDRCIDNKNEEENNDDDDDAKHLLSNQNDNGRRIESTNPTLNVEITSEDRRHSLNDAEKTVDLLEENTVDASSASSTATDIPLKPPSTISDPRWRKCCMVCKFQPPLRSHHCRVCNKCVATFDHHCHFIGTCIGERNHCRFYCFLLCQCMGFLLLCHVIHTSEIGLLKEMTKSMTPRPSDPVPWFLIARVVMAQLYLYPLTGMAVVMVAVHTVLAITNSTTFECSKRSKHIDYLRNVDVMDLPFSQGPKRNIYQFCCIRDTIGNQFAIDKTTKKMEDQWTPIIWNHPGINVSKYSDDWYNNLWRNKYWSCC